VTSFRTPPSALSLRGRQVLRECSQGCEYVVEIPSESSRSHNALWNNRSVPRKQPRESKPRRGLADQANACLVLAATLITTWGQVSPQLNHKHRPKRGLFLLIARRRLAGIPIPTGRPDSQSSGVYLVPVTPGDWESLHMNISCIVSLFATRVVGALKALLDIRHTTSQSRRSDLDGHPCYWRSAPSFVINDTPSRGLGRMHHVRQCNP